MKNFENMKKDLLEKKEQVLASYDSFMSELLDFYCSSRGLENNEDSQKLLIEYFKNMEVEDFEKLGLICSAFMCINDPGNKSARDACEHQFMLAKQLKEAGYYPESPGGDGLSRTALYEQYDSLRVSTLNMILAFLMFLKDDFILDYEESIELMQLSQQELANVLSISSAIMYIENPNDENVQEKFNQEILNKALQQIDDVFLDEKKAETK